MRGRRILFIAALVAVILFVVFLLFSGIIGGEIGSTGGAGADEDTLPVCNESFFDGETGSDYCVGGGPEDHVWCDIDLETLEAYPSLPEEEKARVEECLGVLPPLDSGP